MENLNIILTNAATVATLAGEGYVTAQIWETLTTPANDQAPAVKRGRKPGTKLSEATKAKMSAARKAYLATISPDQHPKAGLYTLTFRNRIMRPIRNLQAWGRSKGLTQEEMTALRSGKVVRGYQVADWRSCQELKA